MIKRLLITTCLVTGLALPASAQIVDKKVSGKQGITPPVTSSELGSSMKIDNKSFNLKSITEGFDESSVQDNIKIYEWDEKEIIKVRNRVNMSTLVKLPDWEIIESFTIGDSSTFEVTFLDENKYPNMLQIRGLVAGADTNFTILGISERVYSFYIRTDPINTKEAPDFTVEVESDKPRGLYRLIDEANGIGPTVHNPPPLPVVDMKQFRMERADYLRTLPPGEDINANYKITSPNGVKGLEIAPHGVFDDGKWTYFDFRQALPSDRAPIVMKVVDGYDSQVNYRWKDGFIIAESTSTEGWTLKNGDKVVCVKRW